MNGLGRINALVLDKDPFILKVLARMLANKGITNVATFDSGRAALRWMDEEYGRPNLILCDLNMPQTEGIEFVQQLAERQFVGSLVLMDDDQAWSLPSESARVAASLVPVLGHLHKPATPEALLELLSKWQRNQPARLNA
ncbi:MAG: response regulator [Burkholderiales bacterium]|nr:response regulator [Burkholderiales bacterium]